MYVTLSDLKTYLGGISSSGDDTLLTACISRAQAWFEAATRRVFEASADTTHYLDAPESGEPLWLDSDLCQITTLRNGDNNIIPANAYVTNPHNQTPYYSVELKPSSGYDWAYSSTPLAALQLTGRWAYGLTAPADVQQAVLRLAAHLYRERDTDALFDIPPAVAQSAALYRRPNP